MILASNGHVMIVAALLSAQTWAFTPWLDRSSSAVSRKQPISRRKIDRPLGARLLPQLASSSPEQASVTTTISPNGHVKTARYNTKSKTKASKRRKGKQRISQGGISEDDLVDHVSSLYIYGPGGILQKKKFSATPISRSSTSTAEDFLKQLDRHPALVLNADYQPLSFLPLSLWHWQEAVKAVFSGKVTVVDVYPDVTVKAVNWEIPLPSVIALNEYVPLHHHSKPAFTKRNVFLRDEYRCQYCRDAFATRDLTLDHVVPRCLGGRLNWTNAVTCCSLCNSRKGSCTLPELQRLGMKLHRPPHTPTQYELAAVAGRMLPRRVHPTWQPFLLTHTRQQKQQSKDRHRQHSSS